MGTCMCLPGHGEPWALLPILPFPSLTHPSAQISVFSIRTQGKWHYKASGLNQTATTTHFWGLPWENPGCLEKGHRLADQWGPRSQPQRQCHSSAPRVRKGTLPPAEKPLQHTACLEKGPASHLLTEASLQSVSGILMPVTGGLSSLQGLWSQPHLP